HSFLVVAREEDREELLRLHDSFIKGEEGIELPAIWRVHRRDGKEIRISATARRYTDTAGEVFKVTTLTDITEMELLRRLKADAERIVRHDLRGQLSGILGGAQLMLTDEDLAPENRQYATYVYESAQTMDNIVNHSLDFAKMEEGIYDLRPVEVNLTEILYHIKKGLEPLLITRNVSMEFFLSDSKLSEDEPLRLSGEREKLTVLFNNLLLNAIEASEPGQEVRVVIDISAEGFRIHIHNQTVVPAGFRERFFDKYSTTQTGKTGLGTYNALLVARAHGGEIRMTSHIGEGTTVSVLLPLG
ncbi:MAG: HAMP domain-containing histidine kinase, partial [Spirochaetales bacterium]|nr:HAMP domain-containing histidine kinase [Spirochaetales bacterium]MCF7938177.1 HAMP domain-containing histidine kinase [Spirochaetales bacterium]